jgi:hypothetical protein
MANKHRKVWKVIPENHFLENKHSQKGKHFPGNQTKFFFDWKVFPVDRKVFFIDWKVFSVANFSNRKQIQKSLKSDFPKTTFQETKHGLKGLNIQEE